MTLRITDVPKLGARICYGIVGLMLVMMMAGASNVTQNLLLEKPRQQRLFDRWTADWTSTIVHELPADTRTEWSELTSDDATFLIRACSVSTKQEPSRDIIAGQNAR